jgi:tetrahydromethanopterin S-methyltransferase subunit D
MYAITVELVIGVVLYRFLLGAIKKSKYVDKNQITKAYPKQNFLYHLGFCFL